MDAFDAVFLDSKIPSSCNFEGEDRSGHRWEATLVSRPADLSDEALLNASVDSGRFRFRSLAVTLSSGRKFHYDLQEISFPVDATAAEAEDLAEQIIKAKYRYSKWDRSNPKTNAEVEIFDFLRSWVLKRVAEVREMRERNSPASE